MNYKDKPICIIPARGGSKRIKNKNIKNFKGKPLIVHAIQLAKKSKIFKEIIVSTDSARIRKLSEKNGALVPFVRNKKLSSDTAGTDSVISDCIKKINSQGTSFHFCIYPTSPLLTINDLKKAYKKIIKTNFERLVAVGEFNFSPLRAFQIVNKNKIKYKFKNFANKRSQDLPELCHDSGTFYIYNTKKFLSKKYSNSSKNWTFYKLENIKTIDINTYEDLRYASFVYDYLKR